MIMMCGALAALITVIKVGEIEVGPEERHDGERITWDIYTRRILMDVFVLPYQVIQEEFYSIDSYRTSQ